MKKISLAAGTCFLSIAFLGAIGSAVEPSTHLSGEPVFFPSKFNRVNQKGNYPSHAPGKVDETIRTRMRNDWPFRQNVEFRYLGKREMLFVRDNDNECQVQWDNIGFFVDRIENAGQCLNLIWTIHQCREPSRAKWEGKHLSVAQLRKVLRDVETSGKDLPFRILKPDFDEESLAMKCFRKDGIWYVYFVVVFDDSIIEYKYAVDNRSRIMQMTRVLVEGPNQYRERLGEWDIDSLHFDYAPWPGFDGVPTEPYDNVEKPRLPLGFVPYRLNSECARFLSDSAFGLEWRKELNSEDRAVRKEAMANLGRLGNRAEDIVPVLQKALQDRGLFVDAELALGAIGPASKGCVPDLRKALADASPEIRKAAIMSLGGIGAPAAEAVPELCELINDPQFTPEVAKTLARIGPSAAKAVPKLREMLRADRDAFWAAWAIVGIGPAAKEAVPELCAALEKGGGYNFDSVVAQALGSIGRDAEKAVPCLRKAMFFAQRTMVLEAPVTALGDIGPAAKDAVPDILKAIRMENCRRFPALQALAKITGKEAVPELRKAMASKASPGGNPPPPDRARILKMLFQLCPPNEVIDDVEKALFDREPVVRIAAAELLSDLGQNIESRPWWLPFLAARDSDWAVREAATKSLGELLPRPNDERFRDDCLFFILNDEKYPVRKAAAEAMVKIQAKLDAADKK